jgi:hypothetical protein
MPSTATLPTCRPPSPRTKRQHFSRKKILHERKEKSMLLTLVEEATVTGNVGFWVEHLPRLFCSVLKQASTQVHACIFQMSMEAIGYLS